MAFRPQTPGVPEDVRPAERSAAEGWPGERVIPPSTLAGRSIPSGRRGLPRHSLVIVVVAALVGSVVSLGVARATGWGRETVVRQVVANTSSINERPSDIQGILARMLPSVVSITATYTRTTPFFGPGGGSTTVTASGTGVIISAAGQVITNDHVVSGATAITVTVNGSSSQLNAAIIGASAANDLALLQVSGASNLTPATLGDSQGTVVGDDVLAVGFALGLGGGPTVTDGIISATGRSVSTESSTGETVTLTGMLQTDAAISSGNSGGPLVNSSAQVIGINTMVATSSGSTTAQNIGFAIPAQTVRTLLPQLRAGAV